MRLVRTLNNQILARKLAAFLGAEGIENQLEITSNTDWGSEHYGDATCMLWIINEDLVPQAQKIISEFEANPQDPRFLNAINKAMSQPDAPLPKDLQKPNPITPDEIFPPSKNLNPKSFRLPNLKNAKGFKVVKGPAISTTFYIIIICALLFLIDSITEPQVKTVDTNLPIIPQVASPLKKNSLYDYPKTYELTDKLVNLYGIEALKTPQELPKDGQILYADLQKTPYWHGIYKKINLHFLSSEPKETTENLNNPPPPMFEKIREGEIWRLFTPCLMHSDILHILFNMMWLVVLGLQMEQRLGSKRYVFFMVVVGILSNTCQYLMSGSDFFGYSGIVCGMLTFIWMRQKVAAWEGYPLLDSTINFMFYFIFTMMIVQIFSFYLEAYFQTSISPNIANTAHISGAFFGAVLGRLSFFSWKA